MRTNESGRISKPPSSLLFRYGENSRDLAHAEPHFCTTRHYQIFSRSLLISKTSLQRKDLKKMTRLAWAQEVPSSNLGAPTKMSSIVFFGLTASRLTRTSSLENRQSGENSGDMDPKPGRFTPSYRLEDRFRMADNSRVGDDKPVSGDLWILRFTKLPPSRYYSGLQNHV